jgi:hypothetical protein
VSEAVADADADADAGHRAQAARWHRNEQVEDRKKPETPKPPAG